ncbi:pseudouridine synthase [Melaminivora sp.]|uniref:pseudouridine synthase n=1 Tax=Melaminivora sp. TaxID=1933032 RepID=UPI0028A82ED3|nr:pseudouridine synthase [Melaminivora sp.]
MDAAAAALPLLWRDAHLVAVYKPAGWLVHRTGLDAGETRFVLQALRDQLGQRVYPVHRLDKGTCGVLVMALDAASAARMAEAFAAQAVAKRYLALVRGWAPAACTIDHPLRPDDAPPDAPVQSALTRTTCLARLELPEASDARHATTRASLVLAEPATGRRHQIRRHLKHIAHPLIGDATHGKGPLNRWWAARLGLGRLWLHAWQLSLRHPADGRLLHLHSGLRWPAQGATPDATAPWRDWHERVFPLPWVQPAAASAPSPAGGGPGWGPAPAG